MREVMVRQLAVIVIVSLGVIRAMVIGELKVSRGELKVSRGELRCLWWTGLLLRRWRCKEVDMVMEIKAVRVKRRRGRKSRRRRGRIGVLCVMEIGRSRIHGGGSYSLICAVSACGRVWNMLRKKRKRV